jgi:hypothetical protein
MKLGQGIDFAEFLADRARVQVRAARGQLPGHHILKSF